MGPVMQTAVLPILLFGACVVGLAIAMRVAGRVLNPHRSGSVKRMPYESGMDPVHDTRRRFDVRFHLLAIAFLIFDVELLFLYPWAVALHPTSGTAAVALTAAPDGAVAPGPAAPEGFAMRPIFAAGLVFFALLTLGLIYDWRKGVFRWR